jgi:TrmH family RNA methyltransferase
VDENMPLSKEKRKVLERLRSPRLRRREGHFLVEGLRGAAEVLRSGQELEIRFGLASPRLFESERGREVAESLAGAHIPVSEVTDGELEGLSDTEQSQGVILVVREPDTSIQDLESQELPRLLVLDGIQDPGNAGTLVRAAWAFGLSGVVALGGTVDLFNAKVVRATAGAVAHLPLFRLPWDELAPWMTSRGIPLLVGDSHGEDVTTSFTDPPWALAVGNEGSGPQGPLLDAAQARIAIPMRTGVDSLNAGVAGAILMFALTSAMGTHTEN